MVMFCKSRLIFPFSSNVALVVTRYLSQKFCRLENEKKSTNRVRGYFRNKTISLFKMETTINYTCLTIIHVCIFVLIGWFV